MLATRHLRSGTAARFPVPDLIDALLAGDEGEVFELADAVLRDTGSRTAVFADLLHPAQVEIGNLWYAGRVSFADEVRAAASVRRLLPRLAPTPAGHPVSSGSLCILAVPHGDPHDVGVQMFALALEDHGWRVETMCPRRHIGEVAGMVAARRPRLFGISAGSPLAAPVLATGIATVRAAGVPVLVGGAAFNRRPDLWRGVGAAGLGTDARVGVVLAQRLAHR
jgi:methanogenic corrinoid protein MtbC1